MTFAVKLAELRTDRKLTKKQLSDLTGISQSLLGAYENSGVEPGLFNAVCLADALGVSLDELVGHTPRRKAGR